MGLQGAVVRAENVFTALYHHSRSEVNQEGGKEKEEMTAMWQAEEMPDAAAAPEQLGPADAAAEVEVADVTAMEVDAVIEDIKKPEEAKADAAVSAEPLENGLASIAAPEAEAKEASGKQVESKKESKLVAKDTEKRAPKVLALLCSLEPA